MGVIRQPKQEAQLETQHGGQPIRMMRLGWLNEGLASSFLDFGVEGREVHHLRKWRIWWLASHQITLTHTRIGDRTARSVLSSPRMSCAVIRLKVRLPSWCRHTESRVFN